MADEKNPLQNFLSNLSLPAIPPRLDALTNAAKNLEYLNRPPVLPYNGNLASEFHKRLSSWIQKYDEALDNEHEVGVRLVSFGQSVTFRLHDIGYWNPSLMSFSGVCEDGTPVELIQHVSQISILLMTLPRLDPSTPKHRIGFDADPKEPTSTSNE